MLRAFFLFSILSSFCLPAPVAAQTQADHSGHAMHQDGGHAAMQSMNTESIMLGMETAEGVKAMAHLNDIGAMMAQMGRKENFHFMIMLTDATTGAPVADGTVALKITDPSGVQGEAIALAGMEGHFGADIVLPAKGEYRFQVGSKLADGKKRLFSFLYTVK